MDVQLTDAPIDRERCLALFHGQERGAVVTFEGVVRPDRRDGKVVLALDYTAYESMAQGQLENIADRAKTEFAINDVVIRHRLGCVAVGEVSVVVAVCAAHRSDAFDACRWLIDQLKRDVPIWKKEIWDRGEVTWGKSEQHE